jgi:hypothetical protein
MGVNPGRMTRLAGGAPAPIKAQGGGSISMSASYCDYQYDPDQRQVNPVGAISMASSVLVAPRAHLYSILQLFT